MSEEAPPEVELERPAAAAATKVDSWGTARLTNWRLKEVGKA